MESSLKDTINNAPEIKVDLDTVLQLKAEVARLKKVEDRAKLAAKATHQAVWDWDLVNNKAIWHENVFTLFGFTTLDLVDDPAWWYENIHPEDRDRVLHRIHKAIDEQWAYWKDEYRFKRGNGTYAHIIDRGYVIVDENGKSVRMVGAMQDVSELKNTELALLEQQLQYKSIFNATSDAICIFNEEGCLVEANPAACEMHGYTYEEMKGMHGKDIVHPTDHEKFISGAEQARLGRSFDVTGRHLKKGGEIIYVEVTGTPFVYKTQSHMLTVIRDVTQQVKAAEEKELFVRLVENTTNYIGFASMEGKSSFINRAGRVMMGIESEQDVKEISILDHFLPEDHSFVRNSFLPELVIKGYYELETNFRNMGTNKPFPVLINAFRIDSPVSGKPAVLAAVIRDLTDKKKVEEAERFLYKSNTILASSLDYNYILAQLVHLCVESISDIAFIDLLQDDGTVKRVEVAFADPSLESKKADTRKFFAKKEYGNHPASQALFYGREVLIEDLDEYMIARIAQSPEHASILRALNVTSVISVPLIISGRCIGALTISTTRSGRKYTTGDLATARELARRAAIAVDNAQLYETNRKALEDLQRTSEALKESEERFRRVQEISIDGFSLMQSLRDDSGKIIDFVYLYRNPAGGRMLKRSHEEVVGRRMLDIMPGTVTLLNDFIRVVEEDITFTTEVHYRHDNIDGWFRIMAVKVGDGFGMTYSDITPAKMLEKQKDEFMGMASHELKTPLTSIKAYLQLLERMTDNPVNKVYVQKASAQAGKLHGLISDLLDISKIQAGQLQLDLTDLKMEDLVDESIETVTHTHRTHTIVRQGGMITANIKGDKTRLEQVLVNLLSNAIKYSPGAEKVIVYTEQNENQVKISVTDFGIGIAPEHQQKIFERFFRVEKETKHFEGLGLGLFIANDIVQRHGGTMSLQSVAGQGSTFSFTLPVEMGG